MKKNLKNVLWVLFILCFIPYVYLACVSIFGANTGFFESSWEYGWETAMRTASGRTARRIFVSVFRIVIQIL